MLKEDDLAEIKLIIKKEIADFAKLLIDGLEDRQTHRSCYYDSNLYDDIIYDISNTISTECERFLNGPKIGNLPPTKCTNCGSQGIKNIVYTYCMDCSFIMGRITKISRDAYNFIALTDDESKTINHRDK